MEKKYYTIFLEKLNIAATQKAPLFNKMALTLSKYAFLSDQDFVDKMYEVAFSYPENEELLQRLSSTYVVSDNFKKWAYCQLCKELSIGIHRYNPKIDSLIKSIRFSHIYFTPEQIKFLKKNFGEYKKEVKQLENIIPVLTHFVPNFLEENREKYQHYFRQLQCYDFLFSNHGVLCDWQFTNESFEEFVVKLCSNRPELFEKIYFRTHFDIHKALIILLKKDFFKNYSGLDVLKFKPAIQEAIGKNANGENFALLKNVMEIILHHPNTCPLLYQFAALSSENNLKNHTLIGEIISLSYADQYLQMLFLIVSNSPSINIELIISDFLKPILDFDEDFKQHLSTATLSTKIQVIPALYRRGIECLVEYMEAFK